LLLRTIGEIRVAPNQLLVEANKAVVVVFLVIQFTLRIKLVECSCFLFHLLVFSFVIHLLLLLLSQLAYQFASIPVVNLLALTSVMSLNGSILIGAPLAILMHVCSLSLVLLFGITDLRQVLSLLLFQCLGF
jgi:hypothetical protein